MTWYNALTVRCGGRSISVVPIFVLLIVLIVLYSMYYRTTLSSEDVLERRHSKTELKRLPKNTRNHQKASQSSETSQKQNALKAAMETEMTSPPLDIIGDMDRSTLVYSSLAPEADSASTKASFILQTDSQQTTEGNIRLDFKEIAVGKKSKEKQVKNMPGESNLNCEKIIAKYKKYKITDEKLLDIWTSCIGGEREQLPVGAELFRQLFVEEVFKSIKCKEPVITVNEGPALPFIALASFPGSGNTWTRVLLDEMNGIYTGSIFTDGMSNKVLKGSLQCPYSKVFIIKTHKTGNGTSGKCGVRKLDYESAIYILRNPYNAIIAEFNRHHAGKVGIATESWFKSQAWLKEADGYSGGWEKHVQYWLSTFEKPVHVLVYEDLVQNTLWELYKISKFVNYRATFETMWCIQKRQKAQVIFKRKKPDWLKADKLFSTQQKTEMNQKITGLISKLTKHPEVHSDLESYVLRV